MFRLLSIVHISSPDPFPSPSGFDSSKVTPGAVGGLVFLGLTFAVVVLLFSFNRHMKRVSFEESED
jgi:hypothetical protein